MNPHRLLIRRDDLSFSERSERMMRDVRRQMDEDLQRFGFGRRGLSSMFGTTSAASALGGASRDPFSLTSRSERDDDVMDRLSRDFFQLRPSSMGSGTRSGSGTSSPRRDNEWGSRESLDDDVTKKLYVEDTSRGQGASDSLGKVFSMNFDVKDYSAEDISVTVEDDTLIVQAKRRIESGDGAVSVKEFSRKIKIPPDVQPERLTSTLTTDGILTVEAPVAPPPGYQLTGGAVSPGGSGNSSPLVGGGGAGGSVEPCAPVSAIPLDTPVFTASGPGGRRRMELCLEIGKPYTPDDICVKLEGRRLIIEACHEEKQAGRTSKSSMQRDFDLTEDIDLTTVQALLRANGQLTITALV